MRAFRQLILGSAAGGLIGGAAFLGAVAVAQVYGFHVTTSGSAADKWIKLTSNGSVADKWVRVRGRCSGKGGTWIKLTNSGSVADEWWKVTTNASVADMDICLSGDTDEWFEHAN